MRPSSWKLGLEAAAVYGFVEALFYELYLQPDEAEETREEPSVEIPSI